MPVAKGWECPSDFAPHLNLYIVLFWLQEGGRSLTLVHLNAAQASMEGRREDTPNRGPSPSESPDSGSSSPGVRLGNRRSPHRQSLDRGMALSFKLLRSEVVLLGLAALAALSYGSFLFGKQLSGGSVFDAADAQVRKSRSKVLMRWGADRKIAPGVWDQQGSPDICPFDADCCRTQQPLGIHSDSQHVGGVASCLCTGTPQDFPPAGAGEAVGSASQGPSLARSRWLLQPGRLSVVENLHGCVSLGVQRCAKDGSTG